MYRLRNNLIKAAREQACIVLCIVMLATMAGLFSSCMRRYMNDSSANQTSEETTAPPHESVPPVESGLPEEVPPIRSEPRENTVPPDNQPEEVEDEPEQVPEKKPDTTPPPNPAPSEEPSPPAIVNPYTPYTWDQMMDEAQKLREAYPELITLSSAGMSVEGRDLLVISLGTGDRKILLCGSHHAREYISSSFLTKMVETYAEKASKGQLLGGYDPGELLNRVTLVVVPMVNPDGVNLVNNGLKTADRREEVEAMAMVGSGYRAWKANINGVDLNRQYPACWEEKFDDVGRPASENYKGTASATEPEVQAMMTLSHSYEFVLSASFHTKGEVIYWADSGTVNEISGAKAIARRIGKLTGYDLMPVSEKPSVYGAGFENWFRQEFLRPSFCIELTPSNGTDEPHDDTKFDVLVWKKARYIGLLLADEALKR